MRHVTGDMWHVICDWWSEVNIMSKIQVISSYSLEWRLSEDLEEIDEFVKESIK